VGGDGDHSIQGLVNREAVASGKVHDDLARVHIRRQRLHHLRQGVIGHSEDEKVALRKVAAAIGVRFETDG
jgi:hypothetical protein